MGASKSLPTIDKPSELLSLKDGTLCAWCDDGLKRISENGEPYRTRALVDLLEASKYCHYCAMWMEGLRQSGRELREDGQATVFKQHPLAQNAIDPKDVKLQFINYHDFHLGTSAQYICWPFQGHMWAKLDLLPAERECALSLYSYCMADHFLQLRPSFTPMNWQLQIRQI